MAVLDASPSRERLGRVVELLRGVDDGLEGVRRAAPRRRRQPRPVRPLPAAWLAADVDEPVG